MMEMITGAITIWMMMKLKIISNFTVFDQEHLFIIGMDGHCDDLSVCIPLVRDNYSGNHGFFALFPHTIQKITSRFDESYTG